MVYVVCLTLGLKVPAIFKLTTLCAAIKEEEEEGQRVLVRCLWMGDPWRGHLCLGWIGKSKHASPTGTSHVKLIECQECFANVVNMPPC
jgi:hypothetical protein